MAKTKKVVAKPKATKVKLTKGVPSIPEVLEVKVPQVSKKELVVRLLLDRVPGLFDRFPQGSLSRSEVEKLVDDILK